jgi:hypothetical protein
MEANKDKQKPKRGGSDDESDASDVESIGSVEFNDYLDGLMTGKKTAKMLDFADDIETTKQTKKRTRSNNNFKECFCYHLLVVEKMIECIFAGAVDEDEEEDDDDDDGDEDEEVADENNDEVTDEEEDEADEESDNDDDDDDDDEEIEEMDVSESEEDEEMSKMPLQSALRKRVSKILEYCGYLK